MPVKGKVKDFREGGVYYIYNAGIEGRDVFGDDEDFRMWECLMQKYLMPVEEKIAPGFKGTRPYLKRRYEEMNLYGQVEIWAYCLLRNGLHILGRQTTERGITDLMRRAGTRYVMWYNQKYKRRGPLFEGIYKAVLLDQPSEILRMSKIIHQKPVVGSVRRFGLVETVTGTTFDEYPYSSYGCYLGKEGKTWVMTKEVLEMAGGVGAYGKLMQLRGG
ncbi:hypothetical protein A2899_01175 [Candidatus Amesbacteria bacterium RIFCSPLOWO2_01_FULL_49_25]|uniref:Transposase IS200-like domain-containing protein n=1 Tax=Candidatus Amesbacteria bacterium RIFCSPHIGHO2_01_FULL_48_32b TaxID=1797253 RepID=A0A1F4YF67_9BACT|nr:MAG: hypothetical protein A2876_03020 [Candidatus Amesbacteria bacterium RIFCSPHIGHO2_01_FULL_48_32b]OGD07766.1 MAG: hypothetical protein A2899_01175 [Candidatus Amesbacteria bacterium RIFCSPLOWO2_01_FULL_49_25]